MNQNQFPTPSSSENTLSVLVHLGGLLTNFIVPLIIFLIKKDDPTAKEELEHAKEALNFQITVLLSWVAASMLGIILVGFLLMPVILIVDFILCIVAAIKASKGVMFRYPVTLRLIK